MRHGDIGTTTQALATGLPQAVLPIAHDQFDSATRLVKHGVALQLTARSSLRQWTARWPACRTTPQSPRLADIKRG